MNQDFRWQQRFENFERGFILLRSALEERAPEAFNQLELEGLVQRFEYTFELAWKTLKDYLEQAGVVLPKSRRAPSSKPPTPPNSLPMVTRGWTCSSIAIS